MPKITKKKKIAAIPTKNNPMNAIMLFTPFYVLTHLIISVIK